MTNDAQIVARLPYPLKEKALKDARLNKVSPSEIVRRALEQYFKKKKYPSDATYPKLYPGNDAPFYPRSKPLTP